MPRTFSLHKRLGQRHPFAPLAWRQRASIVVRTMLRFGCFTALLILARVVHGAEPRIRRDVAYTEPSRDRQNLDIYAPRRQASPDFVLDSWRRLDARR